MMFVLSEARLQGESIQKTLGFSYRLSDVWSPSDIETQNVRVSNALRDGSLAKMQEIYDLVNPQVYNAILATVRQGHRTFGKMVSILF
jgi:hypothetical protein